MRFGTWKCLTRALPPRSPKYSSKHRLCDLQRLCEVRCSSLACWYAMCAGKLEARCFALGGQPLNVGSCKVRFCGCLGSDKGCSQDTISIQFWLIQWQINLGIFFRFRLRTQLWLMTPWEGLPNHSKATMNLCRHTRYLRISHCRTVRREFSKSFRYIPCVSLQISASSSCFLLPHGMINCRRFAVNYYAMGYTVQAGHAHGSQPDALAYWFVSGLKRPCMDIWWCLICIYTLSN